MTLLDTVSKGNMISKRTYKPFSPPMSLSGFHNTVMSATNHPFSIPGEFTGFLAFCPGMVVQTEFRVTPDIYLILGTTILQENHMFIEFQSRQLMMGIESNSESNSFGR